MIQKCLKKLSMTWFPFEYRDLKTFHQDNLPLSTPSNEAAKLYDSFITQMAMYDQDPGKS